ncbi:MFS transporter, partial [Clavibacter californiensis]
LLTISREARAQAGPATPQGAGAAAEAQGDVDREDGE